MKIGPGIALLVIGAILAFAVDVDLEAVDLQLIGYILMGAGVIGIIIGLIWMQSTRAPRRTTTRRVVDDGSRPPREEYTERDLH
ncbi:DUF6458 family protein [Desertihabitans aurantiacus]|uniref:DUF6458 family protein n=1 Tax=Desertihabitans aurantiacus TaxID=2282477 RepID=UPI000DF75E4E|nr:DUF6458 family protein [Desertihabitans aurantiacus]